MKKAIVIVCILIALVLLIPLPAKMKDGGTIHYNSILYDVYDVHRLSVDEGKDFDEGIVVEILGHEIFNNVK